MFEIKLRYGLIKSISYMFDYNLIIISMSLY